MDSFKRSRFGAFLLRHFADLFTQPGQALFLVLAFGFVLSPTRHTVANYLWRSGACAFRHFTRFYVFLGGPFYEAMDWLFVSVIRLAERYVPEGEVLRLRFDDTTAKKTGPTIEAASTYRNGAGTARQEWRTLYGLNFVIGELLVRLRPWPGEFVSLPIGLAVYVKEQQAAELGLGFQSRSQLARQLLDRVAGVVAPDRRIRSVQDGGYATEAFLQGLPARVDVVGRLPRNSPLYGAPSPKPASQPGPQARKGPRLGTPIELAEEEQGWQAHPHEAGAEVRLVRGFWHSVLPGRRLQVVIVRRPHLRQAKTKRQRQRYVEATFTTDLLLSIEEILREYAGRWSIEVLLHELRETCGLGQDRCRRYRRIVAVNAFRLIVGAAEVLFFAEQVEQAEAMDLRRYRRWYRTKGAPRLFDIHWAVREHLFSEGIYPRVGFWETVEEFHGGSSGVMPRAA